MEWTFAGALWWWRGPAPYFFVTVDPNVSLELAALAGALSYGWGMIPVTVTVRATTWTTALFAKDGGYVLPVKAAVRRAEQLVEGDRVTVRLAVAA